MAACTAEEGLEKVPEVAGASPAEAIAGIADVCPHALPAGGRGKICPRLPVGPEFVIALPLFRVRQDLVGFVQLFELVLGRWIVGIDIGVICAGQRAVSFFNLVRRCRAWHPEDFIVLFKLDGHGPMLAW
jgi:hypothetical protein